MLDLRTAIASISVAAALFAIVFSAAVASAQTQQPPAAAETNDEWFERHIRPLLVKRCYGCHGDKVEAKGGLRVTSRDRILTGGDSGAAAVAGEPEASLLLQAVLYDGQLDMPPDKKLPEAEIELFREWIARGIPWPATVNAEEDDAARTHWAFTTLPHTVNVPVLDSTNRSSSSSTKSPDQVVLPQPAFDHPIDRFLEAARREAGVTAVGRADRRTLIRRATFDLTGLPPTPEEVAAFVADEAPGAFPRLIDRLLASPHYGERWGRHWLDVVRYADTAGETADFPVPHAWRYRNYVIEAFNRDKPYDEFLREQIAGDLLAAELVAEGPVAAEAAAGANVDSNSPATPSTGLTERFAELTTATGFIAIARRFGFNAEKDHFLTIDDTIDTVGKCVLGLSLGCARCHDHKYDPVTSEDYYGLYGIFSSTRYPFPGCEAIKAPKDMVPLMPAAEWERTVAPFERQAAELDSRIAKLNEETAGAAARLSSRFAESSRLLAHGSMDDGGEQSIPVATGSGEGAAGGTGASSSGGQSIETEVAIGDWITLTILPRGNHGADTTTVELEIVELSRATAENQAAAVEPRRWSITERAAAESLSANPLADADKNERVWWLLDMRAEMRLLDEPVRDVDGKAGLHGWRRGDTPSALVNSTDQPIAVWTSLPARTFFAHPAPDGGVGVAWRSPIASRVRVTGRVADAHPGGPDGVEWRLTATPSDAVREADKLVDAAKEIRAATSARAELESRRPAMPVAYAVTEGSIADAQMHVRGDPESLGDEIPRRWLAMFGGEAIGGEDGSGRRRLADWMASADNPLTARVMVNRVWQHHFGAGLVKTPNDFGTRGERPTHPELLDWLARRFIADGWSIKRLHRLIMTSDTYQLAATNHHQAAIDSRVVPVDSSDIDPDNVWLWRQSRRRLSAEELRDAILAVSGQLDTSPGGEHPFPPPANWNFTQHNPFAADYDHSRRSVYLMTQRNRRHPLLATFDGPDANSSTPARFTTTVPTQALFFLNDPLVHSASERMAERLLGDASLPDDAARVSAALQTCCGREATETEQASAARFIGEYAAALTDVPESARHAGAWAAWLRAVLSSNEFVYVE